jgi:simple sugar transport system ATP-binding protein
MKRRDDGMSIVLVTHNIYHAYEVAYRFVVLSHSSKIADKKKKIQIQKH